MYEVFRNVWMSIWAIVLVVGVIKTIRATNPNDLKRVSALILYAVVAFAGLGFAEILRQVI